MDSIPKQTAARDASRFLDKTLRDLGADEVALVRNPSYIYSPLEVYPLAPRPTAPLDRLAGIVMDMDGTTTTTEPLCLHSLGWTMGRIAGRQGAGGTGTDWPGLDRERDYPNIIGNSTTRHVEYLLTTYEKEIRPEAFLRSYVLACAWTLSLGRDEGRRREVAVNVPALGLQSLLEDAEFGRLSERAAYSDEPAERMARRLAGALAPRFRTERLSDRVRAAVDIYYARYHRILADLADGLGAQRGEEVLGRAGARLIEPMPSIGVFLAALKGLLGEDLERFHDSLADHVIQKNPNLARAELDLLKPRLAALGRYLSDHPVPVAVVTSSIAYEADIVLNEVFAVLRDQIAAWPLGAKRRDGIVRRFSTPSAFYDAIVTASDSSEIRLKPHRDLYSIALHSMGLGHDDLPSVVGFEDSESGLIAIRAAGVGQAVAVPFAETEGQDLSAAACVLRGQIPEAILLRRCFLSDERLG
ncbi:hypothetical protein JW916_15415 [Candidatus Sumerlaeota bacterium]|nr:hypothetical protein [Candidatus Sumerlaeota bacterium]